MHLTATLAKDDIVRMLTDLTPLRIDLGRRRAISFGRPELVELVPGAGLRVRGHAKMVWEVAGLPLPVTLRRWQILLAPSVARRDGALVMVLEPILEALDFKRVPGFFDERLIDAINEVVASQRRRLAWNLSRALGWKAALPARVAPSGTFEIAPVEASVHVSASEVRIEIELAPELRHVAVATPPRSLRTA